MKNERFRLRYDMRMAAEKTRAEILVYGEVCDSAFKRSPEDMSAMDFKKLLDEAKEKGATGLDLRINSPGGDANQAVAMRTMITNSGLEDVQVHIEGMCASAATLLACIPGVPVSMAEGSEYMIHNPYTWAFGEARALESAAARLRNTEKEACAIYARKSGQSEEDIRAWMDAETWMTAKEAAERGFVDEVLEATEPIVASVSTRHMAAMRETYKHIPDSVKISAENNVSNAPAEVANAAVAENTNKQKEDNHMDIRDITREQLQAENPELVRQLMAAGADEERARIQEIDDFTLPGYESMASDAKKNGTSAMAFYKSLVKAQREKGPNYLSNRAEETKASAKVGNGVPEENDAKNSAKEMADFRDEVEKMAASQRMNSTNAMF